LDLSDFFFLIMLVFWIWRRMATDRRYHFHHIISRMRDL
jgi:hypothetical protein